MTALTYDLCASRPGGDCRPAITMRRSRSVGGADGPNDATPAPHTVS